MARLPIDHLKTHGKARSPHWPAVEKQLLAEHPYCAACGSTKNLVGHHVQPFHEHPELELESSNIIILCESRGGRACHFAFGHFWNWSNANPHVKEMAAGWLATLRGRK